MSATLEEFLLAVRGSPDPMGMDGLGGNTILQFSGRGREEERKVG